MYCILNNICTKRGSKLKSNSWVRKCFLKRLFTPLNRDETGGARGNSYTHHPLELSKNLSPVYRKVCLSSKKVLGND